MILLLLYNLNMLVQQKITLHKKRNKQENFEDSKKYVAKGLGYSDRTKAHNYSLPIEKIVRSPQYTKF